MLLFWSKKGLKRKTASSLCLVEHRNTIDAIAVCEISETVSAFRSVTSIQLPDFFYPMVADQRLHHLLGAGV